MNWFPPSKFEERLKETLIPPSLYIRSLFRRALRSGEPELHLLPFLARRDRISLDIGANKGVYSYGLLPHSAAVHAFEPNPKMYKILERWASGLVELHPVALSNCTGQAELLIPRSDKGFSNQGASLSRVKVRGEHGVVGVNAVRIDDLHLPAIGFMKIDVEGFEQEVLLGAAEVLKRDRPNLLIEIEEAHTMMPLSKMIATVCDYGYRCLVLKRGTLTPFEHVDVEIHHRNSPPRADYIYNFIFVPV